MLDVDHGLAERTAKGQRRKGMREWQTKCRRGGVLKGRLRAQDGGESPREARQGSPDCGRVTCFPCAAIAILTANSGVVTNGTPITAVTSHPLPSSRRTPHAKQRSALEWPVTPKTSTWP